ncbi:MAG: TolC family protein, partial [Candidatus Obscuribacterales bacterium]|nr:TolC family protein [Candidatus Obscuribacterales bacterium]
MMETRSQAQIFLFMARTVTLLAVLLLLNATLAFAQSPLSQADSSGPELDAIKIAASDDEKKDEDVILRGLDEPLKGVSDETTGLSDDAKKLPIDASGLTPGTRKQDYDVINTQAEQFRKRFLQGEAIELRLPMPDQLIPLGDKLPPIRLEASYTTPVSLKDCVDYAIVNNLDIRINREQADSRKWLLVGSLGRFMPDLLLNYRHEYLNGSRLIGGVIPTTFKTPNITTSAGFNFFGFRGGSVLFGALSNLNQYRAAKQQVQGSINDVLLAISTAYYTMMRNEALLEIQTRAVDVSQAQVNLNRQLEKAGTGTRFQVLQSETQLARDQQNLLNQEVSLRRSAVDLATTLNLN